jgi:hypothetical protein
MEIIIKLNISAPIIERHLAALVEALSADPAKLKAMRESLAEKRTALSDVLKPPEGDTP